MLPMGLCGALQMDLLECGVCERILSSQQPDVCRTIPLHNYLRTSGTYKHSEQLQLCLFFFVPYCLFIIVLSRKSFPSSCSLYCVCVSFSHRLVSALSFVTNSLQENIHIPFLAWTHAFLCLFARSTTLAYAYTLFISLSHLVSTRLSLPLTCVLLVTTFDFGQNIISSLSTNSSRAYLLFKFMFYKIVTWSVHVLCELDISSCKWLVNSAGQLSGNVTCYPFPFEFFVSTFYVIT